MRKPSEVTTYLVAATILLLLLYEYMLLTNYNHTSCRRVKFDTSSKTSTITVNLNRIVNNYLKRGDFFIPSSLKQIDWHNYTQIKEERLRVGFGEQGKPERLPETTKSLETKQTVGSIYNKALSDMIALNRSLPDKRSPLCKKRLYLESLPTVSVIIIFCNEHWSLLLRTVNSVINRSPKRLIKEILLIDDDSHKVELKEKLDHYVKEQMPKVKVIHLKSRGGLVTGRILGAKEATGDVLVFLDSHTEVNVNWLPPLLEPIALDYRVAVCPSKDVIDHETFEYKTWNDEGRGGLDWWFNYQRLPLLPKDFENLPEPYETPVTDNGMMAISRRFFWELGGYDPGLIIWGGEQYELSFKIWMCEGRLLEAPCSRVGHVYTYRPPPLLQDLNKKNYLYNFYAKNIRRIVEVWMDEYAQYIYDRLPVFHQVNPGNLIDQKALRQKLQCKPFKWFLTQVAFDFLQKFPPVEPKPLAEGEVRPELNPNLCVHGEDLYVELKLTNCSANDTQEFTFTWYRAIECKMNDICWDVPHSNFRSPVFLFNCHRLRGNQMWNYNTDTKWITDSRRNCLDYDPMSNAIFVNPCNKDLLTQRWIIDKVNEDQMAKADETFEPVTGPVEEWKE